MTAELVPLRPTCACGCPLGYSIERAGFASVRCFACRTFQGALTEAAEVVAEVDTLAAAELRAAISAYIEAGYS